METLFGAGIRGMKARRAGRASPGPGSRSGRTWEICEERPEWVGNGAAFAFNSIFLFSLFRVGRSGAGSKREEGQFRALV